MPLRINKPSEQQMCQYMTQPNHKYRLTRLTYLVESAWCREALFVWFHPNACSVSMSTRTVENKELVYEMQSKKGYKNMVNRLITCFRHIFCRQGSTR